MGSLSISEQDIINALCVYISQKKQIKPQEVEVELMYDDRYGFSAEAFVDGRKQVLITANLIEAIRLCKRFCCSKKQGNNLYFYLNLRVDKRCILYT
nr:YxcD family protein [Priestia filamentosa]